MTSAMNTGAVARVDSNITPSASMFSGDSGGAMVSTAVANLLQLSGNKRPYGSTDSDSGGGGGVGPFDPRLPPSQRNMAKHNVNPITETTLTLKTYKKSYNATLLYGAPVFFNKCETQPGGDELMNDIHNKLAFAGVVQQLTGGGDAVMSRHAKPSKLSVVVGGLTQMSCLWWKNDNDGLYAGTEVGFAAYRYQKMHGPETGGSNFWRLFLDGVGASEAEKREAGNTYLVVVLPAWKDLEAGGKVTINEGHRDLFNTGALQFLGFHRVGFMVHIATSVARSEDVLNAWHSVPNLQKLPMCTVTVLPAANKCLWLGAGRSGGGILNMGLDKAQDEMRSAAGQKGGVSGLGGGGKGREEQEEESSEEEDSAKGPTYGNSFDNASDRSNPGAPSEGEKKQKKVPAGTDV